MPSAPTKPVILISYAPADEPEKPGEGEVRWLSYVAGCLDAALKPGAADIKIEPLSAGGDWDPERERKLRACDIFVLLASPHSLSSDTIAAKQIALIRERQAKGEDVHFVPLLLTPTARSELKAVRGRNLRPRGAKPFSDYPPDDRYRRMSKAADEIANIAARIAARADEPAQRPLQLLGAPLLGDLPSPSVRDGEPGTELELPERKTLQNWLDAQGPEIVVAIAARAALRVAPLVVGAKPKGPPSNNLSQFLVLTGALFRASALARVAGKYPARAVEFHAAAHAAAARVGAARAASRGISASGRGLLSVAAAIAAAFSAADAAASAAPFAAPGAAPFATPVTTSFATRAAPFVAAVAAADADVRAEIRSDSLALLEVGAYRLADLRLWSHRRPDWAEDGWEELKAVLPMDEDWEVWIDWYEDRLRGRSRGEAYEVTFASVPLEVWDQGPAAANAWIREHLP